MRGLLLAALVVSMFAGIFVANFAAAEPVTCNFGGTSHPCCAAGDFPCCYAYETGVNRTKCETCVASNGPWTYGYWFLDTHRCEYVAW